MRTVRLLSAFLGVAMLLPLQTNAAGDITGKGVYKYCEACHGTAGEGGQDGRYPRLAGLPQAYVQRQLHDFKSQDRANKPMLPIFKHVNFDAAVIEMVAAYTAGMSEQPLNLWPYEAPAEVLERFDSRAAFTLAGKDAYQQTCAGCHGDDAKGKSEVEAPPLVNQYVPYLDKQISDFAAGRRTHTHSEQCADLQPGTREAVFDYLVELGK